MGTLYWHLDSIDTVCPYMAVQIAVYAETVMAGTIDSVGSALSL